MDGLSLGLAQGTEMETLIIQKLLGRDEYVLKDSRNNKLSYFPSVEAAEAWCKENGYRCRVQS